jgi:hypothetical protein
MLQALAPVAVNGCLLSGERGKALKILFGRHYPWRRELVKGTVQLGLVFAPKTASMTVIERNAQRRRAAPERLAS